MDSVDGTPFDEETFLERPRGMIVRNEHAVDQEGPQFYTVTDGQRYDLTAGQFETPSDYLDQPAERSEGHTRTKPSTKRSQGRCPT